MNLRNPKIEVIGGRILRIDDCRLWAEIYYLDSPTDYRECIMGSGQNKRSTPEEQELVIPHDGTLSSWTRARKIICRFLATLALKIAQKLDS
jgi:hypothetical protein